MKTETQRTGQALEAAGNSGTAAGKADLLVLRPSSTVPCPASSWSLFFFLLITSLSFLTLFKNNASRLTTASVNRHDELATRQQSCSEGPGVMFGPARSEIKMIG